MNLQNKAAAIAWIKRCALLLLLYKAVTLIIAGGEQIYDTHINRFVWEGIIYIGIAVLITFGINLKNFWIYIFTAVYVATFYYYLLKTGYKVNSPDLWEMYLRKGLAVATLIPLLTDAVLKKSFLRFKELNWIKVALFGLTCVGLFFAVDSMDSYLFFLFIAVYALTSFDKQMTETFVVCLAVANILASTVLSAKSLIERPYEGELRYYGTFTNLHDFGMFVGSALACCLFLALWGFVQFKKKWLIAVVTAPFFMFLSAVFYLINSRNALLGVIVAVLAASWIFSVAINKRKIFNVTILALFIVGMLAIGLVFFFGMNFEKYNGFLEKVPQVYYLAWAYGRPIDPQLLRAGLFPETSILSRLDYFSNHRLSAWKVTVEQLKWFSGNSSEIVVGHWHTNTHNTFLGYLNLMGIVFGGLFISVFIYTLVSSIRRIKIRYDKLKEYGTFSMFVVLWYAYSLTIFMNEMLYMNSFYIIICLLLMGFLPRGEQKIESDSN